MDITTTSDGTLATLAVSGTIDTRAATDFEAEALKALDAGARRLVIDFTRLDLVTSAGIRVLVMLAKRLHGLGGGLVLCSLSADVQRVFEIAGLASQFRIAPTRAGAIASLSAADSKRPPRGSRIAQLVTLVRKVLGGRDDAATTDAASPGISPSHDAPVRLRASAGTVGGGIGRSQLSNQVARLLGSEGDQPRR